MPVTQKAPKWDHPSGSVATSDGTNQRQSSADDDHDAAVAAAAAASDEGSYARDESESREASETTEVGDHQQPPPPILAFGEALLTYRPAPTQSYSGATDTTSGGTPGRSGTTLLVESAGGAELNVAVALSRSTSTPSSWASVLPSGPLGDKVLDAATDAGVDVAGLLVPRFPDSDVGTMHVMPPAGGATADGKRGRKAVPHYQRSRSAFAARVDGSTFDWPTLLRGRSWLVVSGITPLLGRGPRESWTGAIRTAAASGVGVALDLNHRPSLGTFDELWSIVGPELPHVTLLVVSVDSLELLVDRCCCWVAASRCSTVAHAFCTEQLRGGDDDDDDDDDDDQPRELIEDEEVSDLLVALRATLAVPMLGICLKKRRRIGAEEGVGGGRSTAPAVSRCSFVAHPGGCASSRLTPVQHTPLEPIGGGDAWLAGLLSVLCRPDDDDDTVPVTSSAFDESPDGLWGSGAHRRLEEGCRRGDLLAALAQRTPGDQCKATLEDLREIESTGEGMLSGVEEVYDCVHHLKSPPPVGSVHSIAAAAGVDAVVRRLLPATPSRWTDATSALEGRLRSSRVVPIIAPPPASEGLGPALAAQAAEILLDAGLDVIELVLRSKDAEDALAAIVDKCPDACVGAGTVLSLEQARRARDLGAKFIVLPGIDESIVCWCQREGMPVIPGVATATEVMSALRLGLDCVKFFPAETLGGADMIKALSGPFGSRIRWVPTGGINSKNVEEYLALPQVLCCGGTWMVPKGAVASGDTECLRRLAVETVRHKNAVPACTRPPAA